MKTSLPIFAGLLAVAACGAEPAPPESAGTGPVAFVQLFEWQWNDIADECESVLGPAGYTAVQVSPPSEHIVGPAWWTRYQPVSYKIESRGGTRAEFAEMVARCDAAGVGIYADAVINHMADIGSGTGVAGSEYSEFNFPVPYGFDDFHRCGRNGDGRIANYQDAWEVQNCQIGLLADLDTGKPGVQTKIAAYLNDLLSLGVAGFRIDAAKHIHHDELHAILSRLDGDPDLYLEVIDRGGEAISSKDYVRDGRVTEFRYAGMMLDAFERGDLDALTDFWTEPGWLPGDKAVVFVDNHDIQRGHAFGDEVVNYKDGDRYDLAVAFMLAHPYGYPLVMSSYAFENDQQGPPDVSPLAEGGCDAAWVCEHRRPVHASMVGFRAATAGAELSNWQIIGGSVVSFSRGNAGHIAINTGNETARVLLQTGLPPGRYVSLVSGALVTVDDDGRIDTALEPLGFIALLASE